MKIILLIDSLSSGGAQRQIVGLGVLLKRYGYDIKVLTYHDIPFYLGELKRNEVPYENIFKARDPLTRTFYIWKKLRKEKPDVVISYLDIPSIVACLCKILGGRWKLIVSERNTTQIVTKKEKIKFFLYRWADKIVPNSYSQENFIKSHYDNLAGKITTITNFVDTDFFSPAEEGYGRGDQEECRIICVGRVLEQKNILRFIDAVYEVACHRRDFKVSWYGECFPEYTDLCKDKIAKYGLEDIFEFRGVDRNIRDRYRESSIFCLPSVYEGYPNVLCEAMSCGLPILCSDVCDNGKIVRNGDTGLLFNPLDVKSISLSILRFINFTEKERGKMSENCRNYSLGMFSAENFVKKYISLISSC